MARGRLTFAEREVIAARLAAGASYGEIARRLTRPTSTITREVARNGGPNDYRPARAQRAAQLRARRGTRHVPPVPVRATTLPDRKALHELDEQLTDQLADTGFPRMTARVLSCLYLTEASGLTAAELVERLGVSPASISVAVRYLEEHQLITRERGGGRRDRYAVDHDVWFRAWQTSVRRNADLAGTADRAAELLGADSVAGARMERMARFLDHVGRDMVEVAEHWRRTFSAPR